MLNSCAPFSRLADLAYQRRLQDLYYIRSCETMVGNVDELFVLILANDFVPSDDLTKRMVELGVCPNPNCEYDSTLTIAHCDIPIFSKIEAMIIAGCNSIFQTSGSGGGEGSSNSYPVLGTAYISDSDDNTSFVVASTIGKRVISVIRPLATLQDNQWVHDDTDGSIDLVNGAIGLSNGEGVTVLFEDLP